MIWPKIDEAIIKGVPANGMAERKIIARSYTYRL